MMSGEGGHAPVAPGSQSQMHLLQSNQSQENRFNYLSVESLDGKRHAANYHVNSNSGSQAASLNQNAQVLGNNLQMNAGQNQNSAATGNNAAVNNSQNVLGESQFS